MAVMVALVGLTAIAANLCILSLHKNVHECIEQSCPLVTAARNMDKYNMLARFELRNYMEEEDPAKLEEIEKRYQEHIAKHDRIEEKIGVAIDNIITPDEAMKETWQNGIDTVIPKFDKAAKENIAAHREYINIRQQRITEMNHHKKHGFQLLDLLVELQSENLNDKKIYRQLEELETLHTYSALTNKEYLTTGLTTTPGERSSIAGNFKKYNDQFNEKLKELEITLGKNSKSNMIESISKAHNDFSDSALMENRLFDLLEKELVLKEKEKALITETELLAQAGSEIATKLIDLTNSNLKKHNLVTGHKAGLISNASIAFYVLVFLTCWIVTKSLSSRIVKPIEDLTTASKRIAKGDHTKQIEVSSKDEIGELCNSFNIMSDELKEEITERKKAERERGRLLEMLEERNKELQNVVYIASHDLRSPLVTINGFSEELGQLCDEVKNILEKESVDEDVKNKVIPLLKEAIPEDLRFITAGTDKMQMLVKGLLQVSRVGTAVVNMGPLDMDLLIKQIQEAMQYKISNSNVMFKAEKLPGCFGDEAMLNQVFSNLIDNALKYLDKDRQGNIHVSGWEENGNCVYCVEDNGIGIAPQNQKKIFEIFHQLDPHSQTPGEGLGLTIIGRILDRHNGKIWLESEQGKGSKFFVSLPTA